MIKYTPVKLGDDKMNEIANYLYERFEMSVNARRNQIDNNFRRWQDNYSAKPAEAERSTPFPGASNFMPQLIRMHTDILAARMCGIIFATKPFWRPKTWLKNLPHQCMDALAEWLEYKTFSEMELFEPIDTAIFQTTKTGTTIIKGNWEEKTYNGMNAKGDSTLYNQNGMKIYTVPFDDFYPWPITARTLKETQIEFQVLRFTKQEVEWRKQVGIWNSAAADRVITSPNTEGAEAKREAEYRGAGIEVTIDSDRPYTAVEAHFEYLLQDGNTYRFIFTINPKCKGKDGILRAVYNVYPPTIKHFIDLRIMPRDDLFYGYCIPEVLEQSQEEQAQIHNARRDANMIANVPGWKKKMYGNVPNPSSAWYPGKVFELENMEDLEVLQFGGNYNSMMEEEQFLLSLAERYTGIQSPMQGFGAGAMEGKRGIYNSGGTLAMLAEGNKRLDIFLRRLRFPFHRMGNLIYHSYREFNDNETEFAAFGDQASALKQIFSIKEPSEIRGLFFDIGASDSGTNKELDRQNLLLMANTMAAYYRQVVETATMLAQVPPDNPLQGILISVLDGAKDLADRLLFVYEIGDRKRLLPDVRELLEGGAGRPGAAQPPGMPPVEGNVGVSDLQTLSTHLASLKSGLSSDTGGSGIQ